MPNNGYQEFAHTADWGIHVWAEDFTSLLRTAAEGMFALLEIKSDHNSKRSVRFELPESASLEVLLVDFLNELLFLSERDQLKFDEFDLVVEAGVMKAVVSGKDLISQSKEIKAATFHKLEVVENERGYEARIIFDV